MKNIYLVGFMGTGKTTVGKLLAEKLKRRFVEMDETIEKETGQTIPEIFAKNGEQYFRKLESNLLEKLSKEGKLVVSCGGGVICNEKNLKILKRTGVIFNLIASSKTVYKRTKKYKNRPLLNVPNPLGKIEELMKKRAPSYKKAHHQITTEGISADEVTNKIIKVLNG